MKKIMKGMYGILLLLLVIVNVHCETTGNNLFVIN